MQFFPRNGHGLARPQVFDSASDFPIPSLLDRFIRGLKTIEQGVSQCGALVNRERERPF